jgi:hypothetical protein
MSEELVDQDHVNFSDARASKALKTWDTHHAIPSKLSRAILLMLEIDGLTGSW